MNNTSHCILLSLTFCCFLQKCLKIEIYQYDNKFVGNRMCKEYTFFNEHIKKCGKWCQSENINYVKKNRTTSKYFSANATFTRIKFRIRLCIIYIKLDMVCTDEVLLSKGLILNIKWDPFNPYIDARCTWPWKQHFWWFPSL